jgi:hypothetical protein
VGLERGPLSLMRITEKLLEWKVTATVCKRENYGSGDPPRCPHDTPLSAKVGIKFLRQVAVDQFACGLRAAALTRRHPSICKSWHQISPRSGGRSVRLRTKGRRADQATPLYLQKLASNFADKWRSISSLAD